MIDEILERIRGVTTVPALRAIRREYRPADPLPLALQLIEHGELARLFGYELLLKEPLQLAAIRKLAKGLDSWGSVDAFAMYISGPAWRDDRLPDSELERWARSKDRWMRRAALASTIPASRAGGRTARVLRVCALLADDRDDMVVKAMSWALRELTKSDRDAVAAFLAEHDVAPRVRREVGNKLRTGLKTPRRRAKAVPGTRPA